MFGLTRWRAPAIIQEMSDAVIGMTAGNYRILSKISAGGMGTVYRAEHMMIGQQVAIKVLQPEFTNNREVVGRFFNEAKATSSIKHPGIVVVLDFGYLKNGLAYIVLELLEGMPLSRRIKRLGVMSEGEAAALLCGVCSGLSAAHAKGIIHRDLKPDNLFLIEDSDVVGGERIKILDFGIAKLTDMGASDVETKTGAVMGTPTYMSPEQCRGSGDVDERADIYSLGCIFYKLLTGKPPFTVEGAGEVIGMHLFVQPEPPSRKQPGISPDTDALVMSMLAKDPASRPQTARELGQTLAALAAAHGWNTSSGARWSLDGAGYAMVPTPAYLPPELTPMQPGTYPPVRSPTSSPGQPTTLSGAASQVADAPSQSKKKGSLIAVAAAAVVLVGGGVGFSRLHNGGYTTAKSAVASPVATQPSVVAPPRVIAPSPPAVVEEKLDPPQAVVENKAEKPVDLLPAVVKKPIVKKLVAKEPIAKPDEKTPDETMPDETTVPKNDKGHLPVEAVVE
jgi:serine/threonine protein kinase